MGKNRVLLGASYSVIEPLGLLHLGGLAKDSGWETKYHLVKDHNFESFFDKVRDYKPQVVGFNVYTGNHLQLREAFKKLKMDHPEITTIVGGPHPTYFPSESAEFADHVVMSEGFSGLRRILNGKANKGILPITKSEKFPHPDRKTFYDDYPEHANSRIKSVITMTGCPYKCTYCYNSSTPQDIAQNLPPEIAEKLGRSLGMGGRLFPHNVRSVEEVIREGREIAENWPTEVIYSQDDVHGFDIKAWMPEFASRWPREVGIPYHAQMRWEMTKGDSGKKRLDILKKAGCFGLTLAIEAANPLIRKEVLDRGMPEELMFEGMREVIKRDLKVRTEQITGLPYGATSQPTPINLEADLQLVELNVRLKELTGGPTMAWASTLAPYKGTKLGSYCEKHGFYSGDNSDVPDTFFERSVLRFPREWVGPSLEGRKEDESIWLNDEELETYRDQNAMLRKIFNFVTLVPEGHKLAESYLTGKEPFSYKRLGAETEEHLKKLAKKGNPEAISILGRTRDINSSIATLEERCKGKHIIEDLRDLVPYFATLPKGELAIDRILRYSEKKGETRLTSQLFSDATRHHLYDEVLYETEDSKSKDQNSNPVERYPTKI